MLLIPGYITKLRASRFFQVIFPLADLNADRSVSSEVIPDAFEERVARFALGGLGAVLDLGEQLRLNPDALMGDSLGVRLGLPD